MKKQFNSDETMIFKERNSQRKRKPIALKHIIWVSVVVFVILLVAFVFADCFTINQATIIGVAGASGATLFVLFFTLDRENRNDYKEAIISAKIANYATVERSWSEYASLGECVNNQVKQVYKLACKRVRADCSAVTRRM